MKIKKRANNKLLIRLLILFILPTILYNCNNDDDQLIPVEENDANHFESSILTFEKLQTKNRSAAHKLTNINSNNTRLQKKGGSSTNYLSLDKNNILELRTKFYNSYTVPAFKKEMSSNIMINYVLTSYPNGDFKQHIMTYYVDENGFIDDTKTKVESLKGELLLSRGNECVTFSDIQDIKCENIYCDTPGHEDGSQIGKGCIGDILKPTGTNCKVTYLNEEDCSSGGGSSNGGSVGNDNSNTSGNSGTGSGDNSGASIGSGSSAITAPVASAFNDKNFTDFVRKLSPLQQLWVSTNRDLANQFGNLYIESGYSPELVTLIDKSINIFINQGTVADLTSEYEMINFVDLVNLFLISIDGERYSEFQPYLLELKNVDLNIVERQKINLEVAELADLVLKVKITTDIANIDGIHSKIRKIENAISIFPSIHDLKRYWPSNVDEWKIVGQLFGSAALEIILANIPFSDVLNIAEDFDNGDTFALALGLGGLVVDALGVGFIKGFVKSAKIGVKLANAWLKIVDFLEPLAKVINKGFRTKVVDDVLELTDDAGNLIVRGVDEIEAFTKTSKKLDDFGLDDILRNDPDIIKAFQRIDCN
ncbi:hypothetical protein [uncultured Tenacibaculum sp.]|uniref:hypothetical protein n=1 Tax=uncultured Tenacibaculum sp. TaxID=174713 RepID=UPI0026312381|nr:hypothetical protein [uncultured Tenacibaculum sp.]